MFNSYTAVTKNKLQRLFDTCIIEEEKYADVDAYLKQIIKSKDRYHSVSNKHNIPWCVTAIMHATVCDCNFKVHLHNGDSLSGRTTNIPVGYPKGGRPPFTWEQSAEDTFLFYRLHKWSDWSVPGMLHNLTVMSGDDYKIHETAYSTLWCFSNHFKGSKNKNTEKCGAAILLRRMAEKQMILTENSYNKRLADLQHLGAEVQYMPNRSLPKVCELQRLLNLCGAYLREDGRAGKFTAYAYHSITNQYLKGDPEMNER